MQKSVCCIKQSLRSYLLTETSIAGQPDLYEA